MKRTSEVRIAAPTIADVLIQFLDDQKGRLAPKTFARYEYAIELLQHSLDGYAYQSLDKAESKRLDRDGREFCKVFGPGHILPNVAEFLDYFMVRKVIAGKEMLRAAGTAMKKLAVWLVEKGYVESEEAVNAVEHGAKAARNLPNAQSLLFRLHEFAEDQPRGNEADEIEDYFTLTRLEPGRIWVEGMDGRTLGPINVPEEISSRYEVGWTICGVVGRVGKKWRLVDAWNVYPK